jgi:hypothetical protein
VIKATAQGKDGRTMLYLGLSFANLDRFRAEPLDTFLRIDGKEMGLPIDVMLFSGKTEADMTEVMAAGIGPDTKVHVDPKLKS